jgi:hypothetical protein
MPRLHRRDVHASARAAEQAEWFARVVWRSHTDRAHGMGDPSPVKANKDFIVTMETRRPFFCNATTTIRHRR